MNPEELENIIKTITRGNTEAAEALFKKPGGRRYLETLVLVMLCNLPCKEEDKEELFVGFKKVLNKLENRIHHQTEGQKILKSIYG